MPFKLFSDGQTLTANDVMTYMMNQQIMVFDDASDRDATLTNPIHGMFAYIRNRNRLTFFNGNFWRFV